jgi:hypothetical protein
MSQRLERAHLGTQSDIRLSINAVGTDSMFSAPFISSRARHVVSEDARNSHILNAARIAFADLLRTRLIPIYGVHALRVFSSVRFPDSDAEDLLVTELLSASAIPIVRPRHSSKGSLWGADLAAKTNSQWAPAISSTTNAPETISVDLADLASSYYHALHPGLPTSLVTALLRAADRNPGCIQRFSEEQAAEMVLVGDATLDGSEVTRAWLDQCATTLKVLNDVARQSKLSDRLVKKLKSNGFLPTEFGRRATWARVRRAVSAVPAIPGIDSPPILDRRFNRLGVLKEDGFVSTGSMWMNLSQESISKTRPLSIVKSFLNGYAKRIQI